MRRFLELAEALVEGGYSDSELDLRHLGPELPDLAHRLELHQRELGLALGLIGLGEVPVGGRVVRVLLEEGLGRAHDDGRAPLLQGLRDGLRLAGAPRPSRDDEHA